ncbi:BRI1 kinase inhibitor 1-like [Salvia divinorum]|uniref:BRI1 kinase inhibitor 1-like n=1 Tax=Salvia divinorum TaxID=28513 RepID=A0ABD1G8H3_SALDI
MEAHDQMVRISEAQSNVQSTKHSVHLDQTRAASAPPSHSSSPSHEFSFTFSLHPPAAAKHDSKKKHSPPPAIDLSPAGEIFFHGHLVPLQSLPISPRFSTSSQGSLTLPIEEINNISNNNNSRDKSRHAVEGKKKTKTFSFLGIGKKEREDGDRNNQQTEKQKSRFEVIKKCVRSVKAFLTPQGRCQESSGEFIRQQPYSYSGSLRVSKKKSVMRGRFSAPASMRASPKHSGRLVASGASTPTARKSDAAMEEMQEAIQAAIAYCKN